MYKLLTKVLANKQKKVVCKVVSKSQNAFMKRRQIQGGVLMANKAIDSIVKNDVYGVTCKAFDHLNRGFSLSILEKIDSIEK